MITNNKEDQENEQGREEEFDKFSKYLDIWDYENPSYKDINIKRCRIKFFFISFLILLLTFSTYFRTLSLFNTVLIFLTFLIPFLVAFSDDIFCLQYTRFLKAHKLIEFNPFQHFYFWTLERDPESLLIINKSDALTLALRIFQIKTLPENVNPTINHFLKALFNAKLGFSYQVVHRPKIRLSNNNQKKVRNLQHTYDSFTTIDNFETLIYFSVYAKVRGTLTKTKLRDLLASIHQFSNTLKQHIASNFHHTEIDLLSGKDLVDAVRTFFTHHTIKTIPSEKDLAVLKTEFPHMLFKLVFMMVVVIIISLLIIESTYSVILAAIIDLIIIITILSLWGGELKTSLSKIFLRQIDEVSLINPFYDVKFYRIKQFKDTLFMYVAGEFLCAVKMGSLRNAIQPSTMYPEKVFRELTNHNINFVYSLFSTPARRSDDINEYSNCLNDRTKGHLEGILFTIYDKETSKEYKHPGIEFEKWLLKRTGIWKASLNFSVYCYKFLHSLDEEDFFRLEQAATSQFNILSHAFEDNFLEYKLESLKNQKLISGLHSDILKTTHFRLNGSHLNYLYFQGKELIELAKVVNEFKKGIDTRIAAEFNTPLQLDNFITIGYAINTEFLKKEVSAGFTFEQIKHLLITNGTPEQREHLKMRIVAELTNRGIPCIILDYSGNWSKIIRYYQKNRYQNNFLYFKFGHTFNLNLIHSGIQYDHHNVEYLQYFYDAFALAFKEQKRTIELLKKAISDNEELDFSSLTLDMMTKPEWAHNFQSNSLVSLFKEFFDQSMFFSDKALEYENDITPLDFIKTDKTIIIDLSLLTDLTLQTLATFIILSKIIHYINYFGDYYKKMLVIPNIDLFFDQHYIDNNYNSIHYGKINKFLEPLVQHGFGLICSANQIHYLHPNIFNYLNNFVSFKAMDPRDLATLKNIMNLQELHGTGYYSKKRNNTYQIEYLMNMQNTEVLVKRTDINQPFPVAVQYEDLWKTLPLSEEKIFNYMKKQGFNLKASVQKLSAKLKNTIFEKDFGIYAKFIPDVKRFLEGIRLVDKVGNLNEHRLKSELLKSIYSTASERTNNKRTIQAIRNDIFKLLINHGYLIESHPRTAAGGESIQSSFAVGPQFQKALDDEWSLKKNKILEVNVEEIENNGGTYSPNLNELNESIENKEKIDFNEKKLEEEFSHQMGTFYAAMFLFYRDYHRNEFQKALDRGKDLIKNFFINLYEALIATDKAFESRFKDIEVFLLFLIDTHQIPFTKPDLKSYVREIKNIISTDTPLEQKAQKVYDIIWNFYDLLQNHREKNKPSFS